MAREIKFRVWSKDLKCYDDYFELSPHWGDFSGILDDNAFVIEQYTGLRDKNGKEIYEGDIVKETITTDEEITQIYEVYWDEDMLCWGIRGTEGYNYNLHDELWETNRSLEVVGNIHEPKKKGEK